MSPPTQHVLRLRRTDDKSAKHMLVNIAKEGRKDLDLKLIGTDQSELFVVSFKEADTKAYQDRNFKGNLEEWKTLLMFALLHHKPEGLLPDSLQGVETVAAISKTNATITIRKKVGEITQRLGTIPLQKTDTEVDTLEWVDAAAAEADGLRLQLDVLRASVESQRDSIAKLTTELDMLVRAKKAHEDELLSKFAALLNAKKLKIRDQQRLLKSAKIDSDAAIDVSRSKSARTPREASSSRGGKRKANGASLSPLTDSDAADEYGATVNGFDKGEGEGEGEGEGASRHDRVTPEPDEPDAAVEPVEDEEEHAASPEVLAGSGASHRVTQEQTQRRQPSQESDPMDVDEAAPTRQAPTRDMPPKTKEKEPTPPKASNIGDDEDETDDEL